MHAHAKNSGPKLFRGSVTFSGRRREAWSLLVILPALYGLALLALWLDETSVDRLGFAAFLLFLTLIVAGLSCVTCWLSYSRLVRVDRAGIKVTRRPCRRLLCARWDEVRRVKWKGTLILLDAGKHKIALTSGEFASMDWQAMRGEIQLYLEPYVDLITPTPTERALRRIRSYSPRQRAFRWAKIIALACGMTIAVAVPAYLSGATNQQHWRILGYIGIAMIYLVPGVYLFFQLKFRSDWRCR